MILAERLGMTLAAVEEMSTREFDTWAVYLAMRTDPKTGEIWPRTL